jgi:hypothetical protein
MAISSMTFHQKHPDGSMLSIEVLSLQKSDLFQRSMLPLLKWRLLTVSS